MIELLFNFFSLAPSLCWASTRRKAVGTARWRSGARWSSRWSTAFTPAAWTWLSNSAEISRLSTARETDQTRKLSFYKLLMLSLFSKLLSFLWSLIVTLFWRFIFISLWCCHSSQSCYRRCVIIWKVLLLRGRRNNKLVGRFEIGIISICKWLWGIRFNRQQT